jgi:hypothetical protein
MLSSLALLGLLFSPSCSSVPPAPPLLRPWGYTERVGEAALLAGEGDSEGVPFFFLLFFEEENVSSSLETGDLLSDTLLALAFFFFFLW